MAPGNNNKKIQMDTLSFAVIALGVLAFALISGRTQRSIITAPMVFVIFGLIVGPYHLGWVDLDIDRGFIHSLAEITLVLVLFIDAARIDLKLLVKDHNIPIRLLLIGLPLTIIAGSAFAIGMFEQFTIWEAVILAVILSPTDAALGQAVVSSKAIPVCIRQALNIESGMNDGMVLPIILIMLAGAQAVQSDYALEHWFQLVSMQIILGPVIGIGVGYIAGFAIEKGNKLKWITHTFQDLSVLAIALAAFALAELAGGNGFISAFCAGLTLGNSARSICACLYDFGEAEGQLLVLLTFLIFGSMLVPSAIEHMDWNLLIYVGLSLTVVRMLPVALSLIGANVKFPTVIFLGWFGPRGLASILFGLLIVEKSQLASREAILEVIIITVLASVFLHGVTAFPGANLYARLMADLKKKGVCEEHKKVSEMPVRSSYGD